MVPEKVTKEELSSKDLNQYEIQFDAHFGYDYILGAIPYSS
jgi:hypothetical protein